jgi:hypothetical protein
MNSVYSSSRRAILFFGFSALLIACSDSGGDLPIPDSSVLDPASGSSGQQSEAEDGAPSEQKLL